MGNIMGKKTDWIVREMAWRSCGRLFVFVCVAACVHVYHDTETTRERGEKKNQRKQNKNADV